jgi:type III restriction enzyme
VRKDTLSHHHGSEWVNPFAEASSYSRPKKKKKYGQAPIAKSIWKNPPRIEVISPGIPIVGCTCGKTTGFIGLHKKRCALLRFQSSVAEKPLFNTERQQEVAQATLRVLKQFERVARLIDLKKPGNIQRILKRVHTCISPAQSKSANVTVQVEIQDIVSKTIDLFIEKSIDIPKIVLVPKDEGMAGYRDFDLDLTGIQLQPSSKSDQMRSHPEARLEDYVVRGLVDFDDVSYNDHHDILYKLAGAVVRHLQSYLDNENDVRNVLQFHQTELVNMVHSQMRKHREDKVTEYEGIVTEGFTRLRPTSYFLSPGASFRDFRCPVNEKLFRSALFSGFKRCLSPSERFQSDTDRRFAVLLEDQSDPSILKWLKPGKGVFQIHHEKDTAYEPDFVIETKAAKLVCEITRVKGIETSQRQDRADAALKWCEYATQQEKQNGGKPWSYLLIPDDAVKNRLAWAVWRTRLKIESPKKFDELFG